MTAQKIDRILAEEEELIPSSGFLSSVMDRIHEESAAPAPIPFPWKRAIPGMALAAGVLGWSGIAFVRHGAFSSSSGSLTTVLSSIHLAGPPSHSVQQAGWIALALGAALASWLVARAMAGRSSLL